MKPLKLRARGSCLPCVAEVGAAGTEGAGAEVAGAEGAHSATRGAAAANSPTSSTVSRAGRASCGKPIVQSAGRLRRTEIHTLQIYIHSKMTTRTVKRPREAIAWGDSVGR